MQRSDQAGSRSETQDRTQINMAQHVVLNQDSAQRNNAGEDFLLDALRHIFKIEADVAQLHDPVRAPFPQQTSSQIQIIFKALVNHNHLDRAVVKRFHRDGHVKFMDQHVAIGLRRRLLGNVLRSQIQRLPFRFWKQADKFLKFNDRIHGELSW